jgi:hypothetical protein
LRNKIATASLKAFEEAFRAFVRELFEDLRRQDLPRRRWIRISPKDGGIEFQEEERHDWTSVLHLRLLRRLLTSPTDTLERLIEVIRGDAGLAGSILVDSEGRPITEENEQRTWVISRLASGFLREYLADVERPDFDEDRFKDVFCRLLDELRSTTVPVTELNPLMNAQMDCERIDIVQGLSVRKVTIDERERWLNESIEFPLVLMPAMPRVDLCTLDCAIEVKYEKGRYEDWGRLREAREKVSDLVTALRLLIDENVQIAFTRLRFDGILQGGEIRTYSAKRPLRRVNVQLSSSLQTELKHLWERIRSLQDNSRTRLALRRWDVLPERLNQDDALIDCWIAFESLFVPDSFQEVRYRASLRIATFIGETPEEREQIYRELKKSYELRSKIVHGAVSSTRNKSELIGKTRSYLRRALLKLLSMGGNLDPELLELQLLRGNYPYLPTNREPPEAGV